MKIRLTQPVRLRSEELPAGHEFDAADRDALELIAAGMAVDVRPGKSGKPTLVPASPTQPQEE